MLSCISAGFVIAPIATGAWIAPLNSLKRILAVSDRKLGVHIYSFSRQKCYVMQIIPRVCVFCKSYEPAALSPAYSACCDKEWGGRDGWVGSTHPGTNNYLVRSCTITYKPFWARRLFTLPLCGVLIALQWGESARSLGVTVASESLLTGFPQVHPDWICYRTTILWYGTTVSVCACALGVINHGGCWVIMIWYTTALSVVIVSLRGNPFM